MQQSARGLQRQESAWKQVPHHRADQDQALNKPLGLVAQSVRLILKTSRCYGGVVQEVLREHLAFKPCIRVQFI
jgi:hypothetical protein